jgi:hypothetical protein
MRLRLLHMFFSHFLPAPVWSWGPGMAAHSSSFLAARSWLSRSVAGFAPTLAVCGSSSRRKPSVCVPRASLFLAALMVYRRSVFRLGQDCFLPRPGLPCAFFCQMHGLNSNRWSRSLPISAEHGIPPSARSFCLWCRTQIGFWALAVSSAGSEAKPTHRHATAAALPACQYSRSSPGMRRLLMARDVNRPAVMEDTALSPRLRSGNWGEAGTELSGDAIPAASLVSNLWPRRNAGHRADRCRRTERSPGDLPLGAPLPPSARRRRERQKTSPSLTLGIFYDDVPDGPPLRLTAVCLSAVLVWLAGDLVR